MVQDVTGVSHETGYSSASPEMSQNLHLHAGGRGFESLIAHVNFPSQTRGFLYPLACPPRVVPSVKLVVVEKERTTEYDT